MKKRQIIFKFAHPAHHQASKPAEPRKGTFYNPTVAVSPQFSAILMGGAEVSATGGNDRLSTPALKNSSEAIAVVSSVCHQPLRFAPHNREQSFRQFYFSGRGRIKQSSYGQSVSVSKHHPLCTLAFLGFSNFFAPFLAGAKLPSSKHSRQSIRPRLSNVRRNDIHILINTPLATHSSNRLWQVEEGANLSGISFHGAPVLSTHNTPFMQLRLLALGLPPFGDGTTSGTWSAIAAHSRSESPCHAI